MDSFPTLVSIGFPFPSHETTRMILEPGNIEVSYSNYAGLVITLPIARYENAENLGFYVDHFKQFAGDKRY